MNIKYIFIEKLSLISLLKIQRLDSSRYSNYDKENVFYINSTKFTDIVIKIYMYIFSISVTKFNFRFVNLTNDDKSVYGFKKINEDILAIWNIINNEKIYPKSESDYYVNYFVRNIINEWPCYGDMIPLNRLLLMFFAAVFYAKNRSCQYKIIFLIDKLVVLSTQIGVVTGIPVVLYGGLVAITLSVNVSTTSQDVSPAYVSGVTITKISL